MLSMRSSLQGHELKAVVFDFDGVILESVDIKTQAFRKLYEPFGANIADKVVRHHLANGGISRFEKFRLYHREYLNKELNDQEVLYWAERFGQLVVDLILRCPFVDGAEDFFATESSTPYFIASGTPQEELRWIVEKRNLSNKFAGVFGSPTKKLDILKNILLQTGLHAREVLMIGDSINDFEPANELGMPFLGRLYSQMPSPFPSDILAVTTPYQYLGGLLRGF